MVIKDDYTAVKITCSSTWKYLDPIFACIWIPNLPAICHRTEQRYGVENNYNSQKVTDFPLISDW